MSIWTSRASWSYADDVTGQARLAFNVSVQSLRTIYCTFQRLQMKRFENAHLPENVFYSNHLKEIYISFYKNHQMPICYPFPDFTIFSHPLPILSPTFSSFSRACYPLLLFSSHPLHVTFNLVYSRGGHALYFSFSFYPPLFTCSPPVYFTSTHLSVSFYTLSPVVFSNWFEPRVI